MSVLRRFWMALLFAIACCFASVVAASAQVVGISAILGSTDSTHIDTYSATEIQDATTAYYYDAYVEGYLFQNNSQIAGAAASSPPPRMTIELNSSALLNLHAIALLTGDADY